MAEACDATDGTMAAVIGMSADTLRGLCSEASTACGESLELANINGPDQLVVSGHRRAVDWLRSEGPIRGARRVLPLNVGGPFHSTYMQDAARQFASELASVDIQPPTIPVVLNQTAAATTDPEVIRQELAGQIAAPVRWSESLLFMAQAGCELFVEVGPGQVLSGLVRRALPEARTANVADDASLQAAVAAIFESGACR
jgi:[acyl-carrier-protein] S-malonyltransferase